MFLFSAGQTVYFKEDKIYSGKVLAKAVETINLTEAEKEKFQKLPTGNIYFIHGFPGRKFKEEELRDSPEGLLA